MVRVIVLWVVTLLRVALIPVFISLAAEAQHAASTGSDPSAARAAALLTMLVMGGSDLLDGWLARHFGLVSQVGAVVDAVADKLVQIALAAFFALNVGPVFATLPLWFLVVVFGRDLVLLVGVSMLRARYGPLRVVHRWHGKLASTLVFGVLVWAALNLPGWGLRPLMLITALTTVASATVYALDGVRQARKTAV